jgi:hypothetical protein
VTPDDPTVSLVTEQLVLVATIVGAIAGLPTLIDFLVERRKRRERIALSLDDVDVQGLEVRLAGLDSLLAEIADLIDRARHPDAYSALALGNEILVIGPSLSGKKTLAQRIAQDAAMDRLITVYNPRSADALAKAKSLIERYRRVKVMLLLPRIDNAFEDEDQDVLTELDALIETSSERENVLVVGTAVTFRPDSTIDNLFGVKLVLPGTPMRPAASRRPDDGVRRMLQDVARFYLEKARRAGFALGGIDEAAFVERVLAVVSNPAEIEDIVVLCQTAALHRRRVGQASQAEITPAILQTAIGRVIVNVAATEMAPA